MSKRKGTLIITLTRYKTPILVVLGMLTFSLTLLTVHNLQYTPLFPIKIVRVYGIQKSDLAETQHLIDPLVHQGFFSTDIDHIREQLLQMPWVSDIVVQKSWPDQINISMIERKPLAYWNSSSMLLSESGELFTPKHFQEKIAKFSGPLGAQVMMLNIFKEMNRLLEPLHAKIDYLELTPTLTWKLQLDNGIYLYMGHKDILTRLSHFVKVYPKIIGNRTTNVDYVDLRYPNGVAVKWRG